MHARRTRGADAAGGSTTGPLALRGAMGDPGAASKLRRTGVARLAEATRLERVGTILSKHNSYNALGQRLSVIRHACHTLED